MATYMIVHGGFVGGWAWQGVARPIRQAGHEVYTPTLSGLGERAHLASPDIGLETHIQDIVGVLECEDSWDVILVGHSSSAMVVTGTADRVAERIAKLIYIDTAIPQDGDSWLSLLGEEMAHILLEIARAKGDGWRVPLMPGPPRHQPHPLKTVTDKLSLSNPALYRIDRGFVHCTVRPPDSPLAPAWPAFERAAAQARDEGWWYRTLPTDHGPHRTMPSQLASLLLELV